MRERRNRWSEVRDAWDPRDWPVRAPVIVKPLGCGFCCSVKLCRVMFMPLH